MKLLLSIGKVIALASLGIRLAGLYGHLVDSPSWYTWGASGIMSLPDVIAGLLLAVVCLVIIYAYEKKETD